MTKMIAAASLVCFITYTFFTITTLAMMIAIYAGNLASLLPHSKDEVYSAAIYRTLGWLVIAEVWGLFTLVSD